MSFRNLADVYVAQIKIAWAENFQYRLQMIMQLLFIMVEPVVYLVVWQVVARSSGDNVAGYSADDFALYYIMWAMVRQLTVAWAPDMFERRVRRGDLSPMLLRPIHPIHPDTAQLVGWKFVEMMVLVPTLVILWLVFRPVWSVPTWTILAFIPAVILGFVLRYVLMYVLALLAFWITRLEAAFRAYFLVEFFLSGRIAPLGVLPPWLLPVATVLPFSWMFAFPLELILGNRTPREALVGFGVQLLWITVSAVLLRVLWVAGIKRYSAVGG